VVSHDRCRVIEKQRNLIVTFVLEYFVQEVDIVAAAGFNELLSNGSALRRRRRRRCVLVILKGSWGGEERRE